ncbi:MAG: hypothetical protein OQK82_02920 [Candidatus Pacearchaeota archaeon]|nr:hypothetical protein [Candidatus Pacearchaeota archaeon]
MTRYNPLCEKYSMQPTTLDFALGEARMKNRFRPGFEEYLQSCDIDKSTIKDL